MTQPTEPMSESQREKPAIGTGGEFTASWGDVCQCIITGYDAAWDCLLEITYVHPVAGKITKAWIPTDAFRPNAP